MEHRGNQRLRNSESLAAGKDLSAETSDEKTKPGSKASDEKVEKSNRNIKHQTNVSNSEQFIYLPKSKGKASTNELRLSKKKVQIVKLSLAWDNQVKVS
jgi:hypothetical protein